MAVVPEHDNFRLENQDHSSDLSLAHFKQTNVGYVTGGMQTTKNVLTMCWQGFLIHYDWILIRNDIGLDAECSSICSSISISVDLLIGCFHADEYR